MSGPLSHIRVLDLSRVLAGPWASQILADLGASVIKVERPGAGDDTRGWGPPFAPSSDREGEGDAGYFLCANRGKKSICIDLAAEEGQNIVRRLAESSDVVLENFKAGSLSRYGLGYHDLKSLNSKIIYASITGFGQTGPRRDEPGYDFAIQAMGGIMSVTGEPEGDPQKVGIAVADIMTGMYAANAILAALLHRENTGDGQYIDLALFDSMLAALSYQNMNYLLSGEAPRRLGNAHPNLVPYQLFSAADGAVVIAVGNDGQFAKLCAVLNSPDLAKDGRFKKNSGRVRNREVLIPLLESSISKCRLDELLDALSGAGIPCTPVRSVKEALADPQSIERGMIRTMTRGDGADIKQVVCPIHYSLTELDYQQAPPLLGEHTEEILVNELNFTPAQIERLRDKGVIQ